MLRCKQMSFVWIHKEKWLFKWYSSVMVCLLNRYIYRIQQTNWYNPCGSWYHPIGRYDMVTFSLHFDISTYNNSLIHVDSISFIPSVNFDSTIIVCMHINCECRYQIYQTIIGFLWCLMHLLVYKDRGHCRKITSTHFNWLCKCLLQRSLPS